MVQHIVVTKNIVLWFIGGVSISGISRVPFMDQCSHLFVGGSPQSGNACVCTM